MTKKESKWREKSEKSNHMEAKKREFREKTASPVKCCWDPAYQRLSGVPGDKDSDAK